MIQVLNRRPQSLTDSSKQRPILNRRPQSLINNNTPVDPTPSHAPSNKSKNRTNPYDASIREIIKHWNEASCTQSIQEPNNGNARTKTYKRVTEQILPKLFAQEGYGLSIMKKAITIYSNMLSDKNNYVLRDSVIGHKVSFEVFLKGLPNNMKDRVYPSNPVSKNAVWLDECMKPQSYLDKKYGAVKDDKYPEWTKEFEDMLLRPNQTTSNGTPPYAEGEYEEIRFQGSLNMMKDGLSIADRNLLIDASKRLNQFLDLYGVGNGNGTCPIRWAKNDPKILWVKLLFRAISSSISMDYEPSLTWLVSAKTYEELLPKFLKDQFMMNKYFIPKEMPWKNIYERHGK